MILEDATKEAYGYEVWGSTPQSNIPVLALIFLLEGF